MSRSVSRFPAAFVAAAATPALLAAQFVLQLVGPLAFPGAFAIGLVLAALHVLFLAVPIHFLLSRRRTPGPILVLVSSFLIGAVPLPLLFWSEELSTEVLILGLLGLSGGFAFLLMTGPREDWEEA
jgi:RsiW-degrading membrane proteinase PrsW (M82 family)